MTQKEIINRNIGLTFDFVNYLVDNQSEIEKLPENFKLEFREKDFPKLEREQRKRLSTLGMEKKYVRVKNTFEVV